ncbi:hypothetical protein [Candidatus Kuenenia sp.]|uniref:hypothetical protein n=1 Tax=Candidatus Kuenenia sp. TaxID=2499824 RepID=UPI00321FF57C
MSKSDRKQQKKIERKKAKRKVIIAKKMVKSKDESSFVAIDAEKVSHYPVYECLVSREILDIGIGNVLFSRILPNDKIAVIILTVDVYCLGVKNAFYRVISKAEYNDTLREQHNLKDKIQFAEKEPSWIRKLVEGSVSYAKNLGFNPHPDYMKARMLFGDVDPNECAEEIEFGKGGKPFYVAGPRENFTQQKTIINQLTRVCGEDGFEYMAFIQ